MQGHSDPINACAFSPDGQYILSASRYLTLWEVQSGKVLRTFKGHRDDVIACAFSPDGRYALSGGGFYDKTLRLWDVQTGEELHIFQGHSGRVVTCTFSPDGRYALSASQDNTLRLWDLQMGKEVMLWSPDRRELRCLALSQNGFNVVAGDNYGNVHFLKIESVDLGKSIP